MCPVLECEDSIPILGKAQTKMFKTLKSVKSPFPAGGRKGTGFAALVDDSDSDSESDCESVCEEEDPIVEEKPAEFRMPVDGTMYIVRGNDVYEENGTFFGRLSDVSKPRVDFTVILQAAMRGDIKWGDITDEDDVPLRTPSLGYSVFPTYANIWDEPFSDNLDLHLCEMYDTRALSDDEFAACMTWLFANGWHIWRWNRDGFEAIPDNLPPRVWTSADMEGEYIPEPEKPDPRLAALLEALERKPTDPAPVAAPEIKKKKLPAYIPRFCRDGANCTREGCSFEHGDRIQKCNRACGFGANCSKRSQCMYVHPDETWSDQLFIFRE
jgi:hypothetical protein